MEETLALLDGPAEIDLLFVDIGLYDNRHVGLDLAKQAVERKPELRVLYTTGQGVTDGMKALFVENSALLPKPYTVEQLQGILTVSFGNQADDRIKRLNQNRGTFSPAVCSQSPPVHVFSKILHVSPFFARFRIETLPADHSPRWPRKSPSGFGKWVLS